MPPENHHYAPVRSVSTPAHKKTRLNTVAVAVVSMLGGVLATTGVAFALLPAVAGSNVSEAFGDVPSSSSSQVASAKTQTVSGDQAVKTVPAVAKGNQVNGLKASLENEVKSAYPVHRASDVTAQEVEQAVDQVAVAAAYVSEPVAEPVEVASAEPEQRTWVEGWTEEIVHPAVYDDIPNYESYICTECGYESLDASDIVAHMDGHDAGDYLTVDNDCPKVVLEEEWTEKIEHEGHWE